MLQKELCQTRKKSKKNKKKNILLVCGSMWYNNFDKFKNI